MNAECFVLVSIIYHILYYIMQFIRIHSLQYVAMCISMCLKWLSNTMTFSDPLQFANTFAILQTKKKTTTKKIILYIQSKLNNHTHKCAKLPFKLQLQNTPRKSLIKLFHMHAICESKGICNQHLHVFFFGINAKAYWSRVEWSSSTLRNRKICKKSKKKITNGFLEHFLRKQQAIVSDWLLSNSFLSNLLVLSEKKHQSSDFIHLRYKIFFDENLNHGFI